MKKLTYTILIHPADKDETGFWVEVPALPGCFTQGETVEECIERAEEAILGYIESLVKQGESIPEEETPEITSRIQVTFQIPA